MVSVAYLAFAFIACIMGAGLGLMMYRARLARLGSRGSAMTELFHGSEEERWAAIQNWQSYENRVFAACVTGCAAGPVVLAALLTLI